MRTNSIISDPEVTTPAIAKQPAKKKEPQNDFERVSNDENYPQFNAYLDQRIKHFTQYLPNGTPIENLSDEQRAVAWGQAKVAIQELEQIKITLQNFKRRK